MGRGLVSQQHPHNWVMVGAIRLRVLLPRYCFRAPAELLTRPYCFVCTFPLFFVVFNKGLRPL